MKFIYENVIVERVVDGDTLDLAIDLGFGITKRDRFRLNRINAPETRGKEKEYGLITKEYVESKLHPGLQFWTPEELKYPEKSGSKKLVPYESIKVQTIKQGKYGRYVCEIWIDGKNLSDELVEKGLAIKKEY